MWRRHKLETHGMDEIELVQIDVNERVQVVSCVGRALTRRGVPHVHVASQDDEYE